MAITLSDDLDTVDISESEVDKGRIPRTAILSTPNRPANIIQGFNSEGFTFSVTGVWVTAESFRPDYRATVERWKRNNILVKYSDGSVVTWCTIKDFEHRLIPGIPGTDVAIFFSIELAEAIRDVIGDSASGRIDEKPMEGGVIDDMPTEGTYTTWTQTWTVTDATQVWRYAKVDEVNALAYFLANSRIRGRTLAAGTLGLDNATNDITSGNYIGKNPVDSIQGIYHITVDSADGQKFNVFKNGALLFTSASLGQTIVVGSISITGRYIAIIAGGSQDRLFLFTGS